MAEKIKIHFNGFCTYENNDGGPFDEIFEMEQSEYDRIKYDKGAQLKLLSTRVPNVKEIRTGNYTFAPYREDSDRGLHKPVKVRYRGYYNTANKVQTKSFDEIFDLEEREYHRIQYDEKARLALLQTRFPDADSVQGGANFSLCKEDKKENKKNEKEDKKKRPFWVRVLLFPLKVLWWLLKLVLRMFLPF